VRRRRRRGLAGVVIVFAVTMADATVAIRLTRVAGRKNAVRRSINCAVMRRAFRRRRGRPDRRAPIFFARYSLQSR